MDELIEQLPSELFECREVFDQIIGPQLLEHLNGDRLDSILDQCLPSSLTKEEKHETLRLLLNNQISKFDQNPLDVSFTQLKLQKLSPDLLQTLEEVRQLKARALRLEEQKLQCKLLNEVMLSRKNTLQQMLIKSLDSPIDSKTCDSSSDSSNQQTIQSDFERQTNDLFVVKQETISSSSSDELDISQINLGANINVNTQPISSLSTETQNLIVMKRHNRRKNQQSGSSQDTSSMDSIADTSTPMEMIVETIKPIVETNPSQRDTINEESKKRKLKAPTTIKVVVDKTIEPKKEMDLKRLKTAQANKTNTIKTPNIVPISSVELDSTIDDKVSNLLTIQKRNLSVLTESPPKYFFKLLRDAFKSDRKNTCLNLFEVEEKLKFQFAKLDIEYNFNVELIKSALIFLNGILSAPQVISYFDDQQKVLRWEWIGTDTVTELILAQLCQKWCNELTRDIQIVPPPINTTTWTVRPSTTEEKIQFRLQETKRYENPHLAFTYHQHGYSSVVGPVKGCNFVKDIAFNCTTVNKARDHSSLVKDRPAYVTLLSIVRDSVARLPNGEGTKSDICELLKDSQYLIENIADQQLNTILARNLDRLNCEKDSCVKFDSSRRVWIYLHRNRSEEDFERIHKMQLEANKVKRNLTRIQNKKPVPIKTNAIKKVHNVIGSSTTVPCLPNNHSFTNNVNNINVKIPAQMVNNSFSLTETRLGSPVLENTTNGNIQFVAAANFQDEKDGTLVPISFNSDQSLNDTQVVKIKKSTRPKRKLVDHLSSLSLKSDKMQTMEVENKELLPVETNSAKIVKLKPIKKGKKLNSEQAHGVIVSESSNKLLPNQPNLNNLASNNNINLTQLNNTVGSKTAVIITKPSNNKGTNSTTMKLAKQIQIQSHPSTVNSSVTHRISIPTSMLFNANGAPVVLASNSNCLNGIKSLVMSTSGGKIVLHPQNANANLTTTTNKSGLLNGHTSTSNGDSTVSVRTIQGIRVLPVSASNVTIMNGQSIATSNVPQGSVVARIITTNAAASGKATSLNGRQIVVPSTANSFQPLIITSSNSINVSSSSASNLSSSTNTTNLLSSPSTELQSK